MPASVLLLAERLQSGAAAGTSARQGQGEWRVVLQGGGGGGAQRWVGRGAPWSQFNAASQRVTFAGVVQEAGGGGEGGGGGGGKAHHRKLAAPV